MNFSLSFLYGRGCQGWKSQLDKLKAVTKGLPWVLSSLWILVCQFGAGSLTEMKERTVDTRIFTCLTGKPNLRPSSNSYRMISTSCSEDSRNYDIIASWNQSRDFRRLSWTRFQFLGIGLGPGWPTHAARYVWQQPWWWVLKGHKGVESCSPPVWQRKRLWVWAMGLGHTLEPRHSLQTTSQVRSSQRQGKPAPGQAKQKFLPFLFLFF